MSAFDGYGIGRDRERSPAPYVQKYAGDSRSFVGSSGSPYTAPVSSRTVDVQTMSSSLMDRQYEVESCSVADTPSSSCQPCADPTSTARGEQLTVLQQKIAQYIESEMKEKYMEQTRTLEEIQLKMKQELLVRQAQLMQQLQCIDTAPSPITNGNGSALSPPTDSLPRGVTPPDSMDLSNTSVPPYNGHTPFHNGVHGSMDKKNGSNITPSLSADESLNGSNISQGSSHDTWDSATAFAHERPVLTGSERSTPTAVVLPSMDSSNDLELLSQSIHIPVIDSSQTTSFLGQADSRPFCTTDSAATTTTTAAVLSMSLAGMTSDHNLVNSMNASAALITSAAISASHTAAEVAVNGCAEEQVLGLSSHSLPPDDTTPRNHTAEVASGDGPTMKADDSARPESVSSLGENICHLSESSTPPPESPADDLSASLRFSLRQKHSRHLADMKAYYEQELSDLKGKLSSSLAVSQHIVYQTLEADNNKLRERCRILEEELLRANRYINSVDKQMEDLESSFTATLATSTKPAQDENSTISGDEQIYKKKLEQAESYIASLESKNKDLFSAVCNAYEVRDKTARTATQSSIRYEELKQRYEELKTSNELTMAKLQTTETHLSDSRQDLESLKQSVKKLQMDHQKLAKDNEMLRMSTDVSHQSSPSLIKSLSTDENNSPMLKAERHLGKSSIYLSPGKHRSRHHHSDKSRQNARQQSTSHNNDLNKQCSPQPLSDATQSSDNSTKEYSRHTRSKHASSSKKSSNHLSLDHNTSTHHTVGKDDLISAYSPIVDRQRHSSSASSGGPAFKSASPNRQSVDRPFGYHHVGASVSPSKRTQQWAVLSSNRNSDPTTKNREKSSQTTNQSPAMKNLNFSKSPPKSPQKSKIDKEEVLDKVRSGRVFSEEPEQLQAAVSGSSEVSSAYQGRLQLVRDAQTRLDELLIEKRQLESSLTRMSTSHNRKDKQRQETIEQQLDRVDKDLGSVRMTLRRYNAL